MASGRWRKVPVVMCFVMCVGLLCGLAGPVLAQPWPMPEVVLEVHPCERGAGWHTGQYLGVAPWKRYSTSAHSGYWWQDYVFAASGALWIQVTAQNWNSSQIGYAEDDNTYVWINGVYPSDYDGIQTGPAGGWQWRGSLENGERWTLRFLVLGPPGAQLLRIGCDESPVVWWVKVTDLEEQMIYPEQ